MKIIRIIGAALALTVAGAASAADCCKDMACCKDSKQSDCWHDMRKGGDHAGHDMSGNPTK